MKSTTLILSSIAVGAAALLSSCVDPYYAGGTTSTTTVTEYSRPGYTLNTLPTRYETEVVGGVRYYRSENVYYRPQGDRYVVVEAPRGSRGYGSRPYDRSDYGSRDERHDRRDYDGRPYDRGNTTIIRTLPSGARVVTHRGTRYYQSGTTYYQTRGDGYVIVDRPY